MLRIFQLVFLILLHVISLLSQSNIQYVRYICQTNIVKGDLHDGLNTLYFNSTKSLYVHDDWPTRSDSDIKGNVFHFELGDPEGMPVYKNTVSGEMIWKSDYSAPKTPYIFIDTIPNISWDITNQTKYLEKFKCIKARGEFGNRMYTVWFAPEIPVPFGPYKLGGLPGLILQAFSDDDRVSYEFHSVINASSDAINKIEPPEIGERVTYEEFENIRIRSLNEVEAKFNVTHNDPNANMEIEKDKWKIYSTYKAKRKNK